MSAPAKSGHHLRTQLRLLCLFILMQILIAPKCTLSMHASRWSVITVCLYHRGRMRGRNCTRTVFLMYGNSLTIRKRGNATFSIILYRNLLRNEVRATYCKFGVLFLKQYINFTKGGAEDHSNKFLQK